MYVYACMERKKYRLFTLLNNACDAEGIAPAAAESLRLRRTSSGEDLQRKTGRSLKKVIRCASKKLIFALCTKAIVGFIHNEVEYFLGLTVDVFIELIP